MWCRALFALWVGLAPLLAERARADVSDPRFTEEILYRGAGTTSIAFAPDQRMYVAEKRGRVLVFARTSAGYAAPTVFYDLTSSVRSAGESGLLGMKLDPEFASNRYVYLFYTTASDQRLVRVTANSAGTGVVSGSQQVLLSGLPRAVDFHKAGGIQFHPSDPSSIYVGIGDDGARARAQDLDSYHGKILRVSKADGRGLPANPFATTDLSSVRSRIWAYGLRNPFRFVFHPSAPHPDVLYLAEDGDDTDRISRVQIGSNGAWSAAGDDGGFLSPPDARHHVMNTQQPYLTGIAVARGGAFADPAGSDVLLVGNGTRGIVRYRLTGTALDTLEALDGGRAFATNLMQSPAVDMQLGPDGALYFSNTQGGASDGGYFTLRRIRAVSASEPQRPIAAFTTTPSPATGTAPLTVQFTDSSTDADGSIARWAWSFGDGSTSTERNPVHTYVAPGTRTVMLRVTDDSGLTSASSASATVDVRGGFVLTLSGRIFDASTSTTRALASPTELRFYDGSLERPLAFAGGLGPQQNGVAVPAGGVINVQVPLQLSGRRLIISAGEPDADAMQASYRGLALPAGATSLNGFIYYVLSSIAVTGQVRDTRGNPALIDIGIARDSPTGWYSFFGARDSRVSPTGVRHRLSSDVLGFYYFPIRAEDAGRSFFFDLLADTNTAIFTGLDFSLQVAANQRFTRDVLVGRRAGGQLCDNLSSIPTTPNVDYESQIRPIFEAQCTGCHSPTATDDGGLDLQTNAAAALIRVPSGLVPGLPRVTPRDLAGSFLMEKINCASPQRGTRMRPTDAMSREQQALIRDWILQLP